MTKRSLFLAGLAAAVLLAFARVEATIPLAVTYSYDAAGRLTNAAYANSPAPITYVYDAAGNLVSRNGGFAPAPASSRGAAFRALSFVGTGPAAVELTKSGVAVKWSGVPGKNYRLQYKDDLTDPVWKDVPGAATAADATGAASQTDPGPLPAHRFYKIVPAP